MDERDPELARTAALAAELRIVLGKLKRRMRGEAQLGDLSWTQVRVLVRLEQDGPATVSALAAAEGMRPQSMGETVAALKAAGLVSGAPDPADGRRTLLSLTDACVKKVQAARAAREDWLFRALRRHLTPPEQKKLAAAVELLARLAEP
ncbi:MarR family winged helix-turn-helix transcriptional regulator [Geothrix sp. 21YS21S-4]|uniref:MarR family winged helix-turn-helix transcriptional regulator n=1 Tax=Geothrix sp. 21YS21S-4 TaxID=3068889 RepID=UPI0027BAEC33|nr:MarR family transcriptional regulator [Geothrix sp. 21YS21S-4]